MKKNKSSGTKRDAIEQSQRACQRLGDGGTYIGGGRLFKKSIASEPTLATNTTALTNDEIAEQISASSADKQENKRSNAVVASAPTFTDGINLTSKSCASKSFKTASRDSQTTKQSLVLESDIEKMEEKREIIVPYGDYHTHTVFSDGISTLEENIQHAIAIGLKEYAVTDHAFRHRAHGITLTNFQVQKRMVELYREKYPQIKIYHSLEGNIMGYSGLLDTDAYIDDLDFMQMGFHKTASNEDFATWWSFTLMNLIFRPGKAKIEKNTLAYLRCIDRYPLKFVNHLNYGVLVDCKEIAKLCLERGTKIELNGKRVLFSQQEVDDMLEVGVDFVVNSDAHISERVGDVALPIEFAKTHGIPLERIVNLNKSIL